MIGKAGRKNARRKKLQNGRERPHFFGLQPPKKFLGSLPPVLLQSATDGEPQSSSHRTDVLRRTQHDGATQLFSFSYDFMRHKLPPKH